MEIVSQINKKEGNHPLFNPNTALFGRRSEVKDNHDRYANIEINYLLQRMENYRGVAIIATNSRDTIDEAFVRRLEFVVSFPFPDEKSRKQIWRHIFPKETPVRFEYEKQI